MNLFVCETVKSEVTNVEFLSRNLSLKNSAVMVKWKCLKLLYSSKGMCRIDSQLKKLIRLKHLILGTLYTFFSIFSRYCIVLHTLNFLLPMFSGINNNNFSFFGFSNFSFFVFVITTLKRQYLFLNIFRIDLILFRVKALNITESVLWLPNHFKKH